MYIYRLRRRIQPSHIGIKGNGFQQSFETALLTPLLFSWPLRGGSFFGRFHFFGGHLNIVTCLRALTAGARRHLRVGARARGTKGHGAEPKKCPPAVVLRWWCARFPGRRPLRLRLVSAAFFRLFGRRCPTPRGRAPTPFGCLRFPLPLALPARDAPAFRPLRPTFRSDNLRLPPLLRPRFVERIKQLHSKRRQ